MQPVAKTKEPSDSDGPVRANALEERLRVNLNRFIAQSGYSAQQVADLSGITQASLSRYTRGENALQADALLPLAQVFGRSVEDFYDRDPPPVDKEALEKNFLFLKSRPGFEPTEEDLADFEAFLERARKRREKKQKAK